MLKLLLVSLSKEPLSLEFETMGITMLLLHIAVPKQATRFTTFDLERVMVAWSS